VLRPRSRGRVRLASSNPLAAPAIDTAQLQDIEDVRLLVRGFRQLRDVVNQPALARFGARERSAALKSDAEIEAFIRQNSDGIYHPVGTCRMGSGPLDVVDDQLRVRGLQGLRVVDASIMPRLISGNTNAPTVMIAEKVARMMRGA
jgi:choline dehydrogenase-like flavoprotein